MKHKIKLQAILNMTYIVKKVVSIKMSTLPTFNSFIFWVLLIESINSGKVYEITVVPFNFISLESLMKKSWNMETNSTVKEENGSFNKAIISISTSVGQNCSSRKRVHPYEILTNCIIGVF